jgi:hypothetical protein
MTKRKWLRAVLIGAVALFVASFVFSRVLRAGGSRRYLIAHLAASFGRPVEVSWFDFSLLDGARIEAHFVSVSDDPHFGNEYFLRADTLTAGLQWTALLAGRFEFGSVSLSRPSLNLARDAEGHWNIERWLPPASPPGARPGFVGPLAPARDVRAARPYRIDVEGGRINFKQGDNKNPFALDGVSGRLELNGEGRWQLDLEARPMRAGVELQDIGTLRLRGSIAGTTARLQPAELNLAWRAASLADALRLVRQDDYGMRGQLSVDLNARISPTETSPIRGADSGGARWSISAVARLTGMHGWRLPERGTDPAANLAVEMNWRLGERRAEFRKLIAELPASRLVGDGDLDWTHGLRPQLHIESSTLALGDVLSWYRALQPDVAEDLRVEGGLGLDIKLGGWPMELENGAIVSAGGTLAAKSLPEPLQIGALNASISPGEIDFAPAEISFASFPSPEVQIDAAPTGSASRNSFVMRGSLFSRGNGVIHWPPDANFSIEGATSRVQDWLALSGALAHPINPDWAAAGGLAVKIRGVHRAESPAIPWLGTMDFLGLTFSPASVNQSLRLAKGHVEFAPLQRTVALSSAEAFGAVWHGSLARKYSDKQWTFDLSADRLDATDLDRWLGPRARPGFLARFTGSNSTAIAAPFGGAVVTRLVARGRLRAGEIDIPPIHIEQFEGEAELAGRTVRIRKAQADFFGGKISGSLDAQLLPDPSYQFQGRFDHVDLAQLGRAVPFLNDRIGGNASATLALSAHGIGRQDLIGSMQGQGTINGRNVELRGSNLSGAFPGDNPDISPDLFASIQGMYRIQNKGIDLANFVMDNSRGRLEAEGRIDFSRALNIRVRPSIFQAATAPASALPPSFLLSGTIETPKLVLPSAAPNPAGRPNPR